MAIEEAILDRLKALPAEQQREVLDFAEFLGQKNRDRRPLRSVRGLWKQLGGDEITAEEIAELRREMWGGFPRGDL